MKKERIQFLVIFLMIVFPVVYGTALVAQHTSSNGIVTDNKTGHIINIADYPYWRALSDTSAMFFAMKADALANNGQETSDVMGANALAYILDPENKATYIANIQDKFETRIKTMTIGNGAATSSVPSHELFFALLALDVIQSDLDAAELSTYEGLLQEKIFKLVLGKWDPHAWAMRMLWYKYVGDEDNFQAAKEEWEIGLSEHYMPNDGVSPAGNGYCVQRWNSIERSAKNTTGNIMAYMGYDNYYTNPGIIGLKEYMYGYAVAPFGRILLYGDSRNTQAQETWDIAGRNTILSPHIVSAARFSPEAYKYAMWVLREGAGVTKGKLKGYLSNYIIMAGSAAKNDPITFNTDDAELAPSRTFENYAVLVEDKQSTEALFLSMLNLKGNTEYHTHYETNALAMAGYGEILMRNAGYDGPNNDATVDGVTATFDFMHSNSKAANTLTIGGKRHTVKTGGGIVEGLVGTDIEYARGLSADAIDGVHHRDILFMQPTDGANGYYLVMDHVRTNNADDKVNVTWHPNAATLNIIDDATEYFSEIKIEKGADGPRLYSNNKATLSTFLATPPSSVEVKRTANQSRAGYAFAGDYMYVNYDAVDHKVDLLTVLFPGDKTHSVGDMSRIEAGTYSGAEIVQGDVHDIALVSDGAAAASYNGFNFQGEDIICRKFSDRIVSYFVKGTCFNGGHNIPCGFKSDESLVLFMKTPDDEGTVLSGKITTKGTMVTFYHAGIKAVTLDGVKAKVITSDDNWLKVFVPAGTFEVKIH